MSTIEYAITDKLKNYRKVFYLIGYYGIAVVLLFSGVSKILDASPLMKVLEQIKLPTDLAIGIATILPVIEIGLGLMLLLKIRVRTALRITALLFLIFFLFAVYGTSIGLNNDCGCFGKTIKSEFGWVMIARNAVLLILSVVIIRTEK